MIISEKIVNTALIIEKRIFPIIFIYFSIKHMLAVYIHLKTLVPYLSHVDSLDSHSFIILSDVAIALILIPFNALIAYALFITRNLHHKPEGFLELFVPLLATFWFLTYNMIPYLPSDVNFLMIPQTLLPLSIITGSILALTGLIIASWGIFNLRKSFGIFVQVRDVVTKGLYRYVRHPIYCGHIMAHFGFFLIIPRLYALILSCGLVVVTLYRAKLEERKLMANSQEYQEYAKKTPFILPIKFGR